MSLYSSLINLFKKGDTVGTTDQGVVVLGGTALGKYTNLSMDSNGQVYTHSLSNDSLVGAKTDADPGTDNGAGSLNALLKRVNGRITSLITAVTSSIVLAAGENFLGFVGGKCSVTQVTLTRTSDSNGVTPYASGNLFGANLEVNASNIITIQIARVNDATFLISRLRAKINNSAWASKRMKIHFYRDQPTLSVGDHGAFNAGGAATESRKIGEISITFNATATSDGYVKGYGYPDDTAGLVWTCEPSSGTRNIFAVVEVLDIVTPVAGSILTLAIESPGIN